MCTVRELSGVGVSVWTGEAMRGRRGKYFNKTRVAHGKAFTHMVWGVSWLQGCVRVFCACVFVMCVFACGGLPRECKLFFLRSFCF